MKYKYTIHFFVIYQLINNKEKVSAILTVALMDADKPQCEHMNWNLHAQHLQKNREKDETRDRNSPPLFFFWNWYHIIRQT